MVDVGEWMCQPLLRCIPRTVTPNQITILNHVANWALFGLCAFGASHLGLNNSEVLVGAALINIGCTAMDCLDGMHARATGQTSKIGEAMDHGMDAANVPLVTASMSLALGMSPMTTVVCTAINACMYASQVLCMKTTGSFDATTGVEGQLAGSALLFASLWWPDEIRQLAGVCFPIVMLAMTLPFVRRLGFIERMEFVKIIFIQFVYAYLWHHTRLIPLPAVIAIMSLHSLCETGITVIECTLEDDTD